MVRVFAAFHMMGRDVLVVFEISISSANSDATFKTILTAAFSTKIISPAVAQTGVKVFYVNKEQSLHQTIYTENNLYFILKLWYIVSNFSSIGTEKFVRE